MFPGWLWNVSGYGTSALARVPQPEQFHNHRKHRVEFSICRTPQAAVSWMCQRLFFWECQTEYRSWCVPFCHGVLQSVCGVVWVRFTCWNVWFARVWPQLWGNVRYCWQRWRVLWFGNWGNSSGLWRRSDCSERDAPGHRFWSCRKVRELLFAFWLYGMRQNLWVFLLKIFLVKDMYVRHLCKLFSCISCLNFWLQWRHHINADSTWVQSTWWDGRAVRCNFALVSYCFCTGYFGSLACGICWKLVCGTLSKKSFPILVLQWQLQREFCDFWRRRSWVLRRIWLLQETNQCGHSEVVVNQNVCSKHGEENVMGCHFVSRMVVQEVFSTWLSPPQIRWSNIEKPETLHLTNFQNSLCCFMNEVWRKDKKEFPGETLKQIVIML